MLMSEPERFYELVYAGVLGRWTPDRSPVSSAERFNKRRE